MYVFSFSLFSCSAVTGEWIWDVICREAGRWAISGSLYYSLSYDWIIGQGIRVMTMPCIDLLWKNLMLFPMSLDPWCSCRCVIFWGIGGTCDFLVFDRICSLDGMSLYNHYYIVKDCILLADSFFFLSFPVADLEEESAEAREQAEEARYYLHNQCCTENLSLSEPFLTATKHRTHLGHV